MKAIGIMIVKTIKQKNKNRLKIKQERRGEIGKVMKMAEGEGTDKTMKK